MRVDYIQSQKIEKDICLLYKQLSEYSGLMGDLDYNEIFSLHYWKYLKAQDLEADDQNFILGGCLVLILCMIWDAIDGSGMYISSHLKSIKNCLSSSNFIDNDLQKLVNIALSGVLFLEGQKSDNQEFIVGSEWAYDTYVRGYFLSLADNA